MNEDELNTFILREGRQRGNEEALRWINHLLTDRLKLRAELRYQSELREAEQAYAEQLAKRVKELSAQLRKEQRKKRAIPPLPTGRPASPSA